MKRRCLLGLTLGMVAWSAGARADLGADVRALSAARATAGRLLRLKPRLLERGERLALAIPPEFLDPKSSTCTTVTLLGVVGLHFAVRFSELDPNAPSTAFAEQSVVGASEITRCGSSKPFLSGLQLEMRSPRGLIETLLSVARVGQPRLSELLPDRDPGNELSLGEPGPRPALPPLGERLARLSMRASRDGAESFQQAHFQAADDGTGADRLSLDAGCHELTLLAAPAPGLARVVDLDLQLVEQESGAQLAVDRAEDADASLSLCVGTTTPVELRFTGAPPSSVLSLTHARWLLPLGLPSAWGDDVRARLARVARTHHLRLAKPPIYGSLGVQGTTELGLEVEPGACYSALLIPLRGEVRSLSVSVRAQAPNESARSAADSEGSAVSFCAHGARRASLEVSGEGANLAWLVALWESGRTAIGVAER